MPGRMLYGLRPVLGALARVPQMGILCVILFSLLVSFFSPSVFAINYSVPYARGGLTSQIGGYGATIGQIEVGNGGNGINGFDGSRHITFNYGIDYGGGLVIQQPNYIDVKDFMDGDPTDTNGHGTMVAGIMAANGVLGTTPPIYLTGMAPFANYYGAIFDGSDTKAAYLTLHSSLNYLVNTAGAKAINNSWGGAVPQQQLNGYGSTSLLMDEYTGYAGKTGGTTASYKDRLMVISAGNDGETTGLLGQPADAYNVLVVGALDALSYTNVIDDPSRSPAPRIASYSSWRPLTDGRSGVHVVAPGSAIVSMLGTNDLGMGSGTSFAAPHVTGEAALLYGAAAYPGGLSDRGSVLSTDHKLIKALIINSADKIAGLDSNGVAQTTWQPGLVVTNEAGVVNAVVPLNYAVGAGQINANEAVQQYFEIGNRFWDTNTISITGSDFYYTFGSGKFSPANGTDFALTSLTATLVWDRHLDFTVNTNVDDNAIGTIDKDLLSNLDLILQKQVSPGVWQDVYESAGTLDNVEHIYMTSLDTNSIYRLDVRGSSIAEADLGESYALAVQFTSVPEPSTVWLLGGGLAIFAWRRLKKRIPR